jgi:hygromycin-B 7''-O-kinase
MGVALARLQDARWESWGQFDPASERMVPAPRSYAEHVLVQIEDALSASVSAGASSEGDAKWVRHEVTVRREALEVPFAPAFVHADYTRGNLCAERLDAGGWKVSGVLDFQRSHAGDGESDLTRACAELAALRPELARELIRAYAALRPPRSGFAERFIVYLVRERLEIWLYGHAKAAWFPVDLGLRAWLEPQLRPPL